MTHVPHGLAEEFPEMGERLQRLRQSNAHFAKLCSAYEDINHAIHRYETNIEPTDDTTMENARKKRLKLKDEIYGLLAA